MLASLLYTACFLACFVLICCAFVAWFAHRLVSCLAGWPAIYLTGWLAYIYALFAEIVLIRFDNSFAFGWFDLLSISLFCLALL